MLIFTNSNLVITNFQSTIL